MRAIGRRESRAKSPLAEFEGTFSAKSHPTMVAQKTLTDDKRPIEKRIEDLYLLAFSRKPNSTEIEIARNHIQTREKPREGFEDVVWALINTKEFLFNH